MDSPRYCALCSAWGNHHTDRHVLDDAERLMLRAWLDEVSHPDFNSTRQAMANAARRTGTTPGRINFLVTHSTREQREACRGRLRDPPR